ncbi:MAG: sensor histidine kinase [Chloroflexota bacterium]|jgi:signal transduction histidine kinase
MIKRALDTPANSVNPHTWRSRIVRRSTFLLVLPTLISLVVVVIFMIAYQNAFPLVGMPNELPDGPPWLPPIVPIVIVSITTLLLLRMGQLNVSAVILMSFWTIAVTIVTLRFGAHTFFPALLILPIGVASLLYNSRISMMLAIVSTLVVGLSAWSITQESEFVIFDFVRTRVISDPNQVNVFMTVSMVFWSTLFVAVSVVTSTLANDLQRTSLQNAAHVQALQELSAQLESRVASQTASLLAGEREKAMLAERTRLARDIHDTLAQGLTGIIVQLGAAEQAMRAHHPDAAEHLDIAARMARESLAEARRSVWNLRAEALERGDLRHAISGIVERFRHPSLIASCEIEGDWIALSIDIESALLRVAQEGLANAARHSQASHVVITLRSLPTAIELEIRDNGRGFGDRLENVDSYATSFGILGMRERLSALHGTLQCRDDQGAVVYVHVPRLVEQGVHVS